MQKQRYLWGLNRQHDSRDRNRTPLNRQMGMVIHETVGVQPEIEPLPVVWQTAEVPLPIRIVAEDRLALIASHDQMVDRARSHTKRPSHLQNTPTHG